MGNNEGDGWKKTFCPSGTDGSKTFRTKPMAGITPMQWRQCLFLINSKETKFNTCNWKRSEALGEHWITWSNDTVCSRIVGFHHWPWAFTWASLLSHFSISPLSTLSFFFFQLDSCSTSTTHWQAEIARKLICHFACLPFSYLSETL